MSGHAVGEVRRACCNDWLSAGGVLTIALSACNPMPRATPGGRVPFRGELRGTLRSDLAEGSALMYGRC